MATKQLGIILNGATGRICRTQHMRGGLVPIRDEGGLTVGDDQIVPRMLLTGRNEDRLAELAREHGIEEWTTDLTWPWPIRISRYFLMPQPPICVLIP